LIDRSIDRLIERHTGWQKNR